MFVKASTWFAVNLLGSVLAMSPIAIAAEKSDMIKDEKAGMMKEEKGKMIKDSKEMMKDQMKEMKAKKTDDTMKMNKMEEKK